MDKRFKKMLKPFTFSATQIQRMFKLLPAIQTIGFIPQKKDFIREKFNSCNFSFILEGKGVYILNGKEYEVKSPCMLIQWPNEPMYYGPDDSWSEMFFIYGSDTFSSWQQARLLEPSNPVRHMYNFGNVRQKVMELQQLLTDDFRDGDRLDLLCYSLILETWLTEHKCMLGKTLIPQIRQRLEESLGEDIDCVALAKEFNMSVSTLRRYYRKYCGNETFMQYRNNFFLRQSCPLLLDTDLTVKEIAEKLKFQDPFYFSRKFHELSGTPPLEFRKRSRR